MTRDDLFEERLRLLMRRYTEEALEYGVRPVLIIGVQDPGHEVFVLHDEALLSEMVIQCLSDTLEAMKRRGEETTTG